MYLLINQYMSLYSIPQLYGKENKLCGSVLLPNVYVSIKSNLSPTKSRDQTHQSAPQRQAASLL